MEAYFRARVISVLSDYPCYFWVHRDDGTNTGLRPRVWADWYGHLRDALDVVEANTEPGEFRNRLLSHWYRSKGLRLLGAGLTGRDDADARALIAALRDLAAERFPLGVDDQLPAIMRIRSTLLRAGDVDTIRELAAAERGMHAKHRVLRLRPADGGLEIGLRAILAYGGGAPVRLVPRHGDFVWDAPVELADELPAYMSGAGPPRIDVVLRHRDTDEAYMLPGTTDPLGPGREGAIRLGGKVSARLDPQTLKAGRPLTPGVWYVRVQLAACGWQVHRTVRAPAGLEATPWSLPGWTITPVAIERGYLALDVTAARRRPVLARARALLRR
jgi:hypothetical protein